jgi:hypothetical protein
MNLKNESTTYVTCIFNFQSSKTKTNLQPVVLPEILEAHKQKCRDIIKKESVGPIEHCNSNINKFHIIFLTNMSFSSRSIITVHSYIENLFHFNFP